MSALHQLPERVTLATIAAERDALRATLAAQSDVVIDASQLIEGDLSLIQLLLSTRKEAVLRHRTLRLAAPANDALCALLTRAGLAAQDLDFWHHGKIPA